MDEPAARRALIYARISIDRVGESEAPDRQIEACRRHCEAHGIAVVAEYIERDRSAFAKGGSRPEYEAMLHAVEAGEVEAVVAWKIDRISRRVAELAALVDRFREMGVALMCPGDGVDTSTATGALIATLIGSIAQMESEANSQRRIAKNQADAVNGKYVKGGFRSFGRLMDGTVVEAEAEAIRQVVEHVIDGESLGSQARWLNDHGLRTTRGNAWLGTTLGRALREPHLRGIRVHNGDEHRGAFDPILDETTGLRLIERLRGNPVSRKGRSHLLSGLARCGRCGARLNRGQVAHPNDPTKPPFLRYQCRKTDGERNCGGVSASEPSLDALVTDQFFRQMRLLMMSGEVDPASDNADALAVDRQATLDRIREAEVAQSDLADARFKERTVSAEDYNRLWLELETEIERAQQDLLRREAAEVAPRRDPNWIFGRDFEDLWDSKSVLERRDWLREVIDRVVVSPAKRRGGNRFDPERVEIIWQPGFRLPEWFTDDGDENLPLGYRAPE